MTAAQLKASILDLAIRGQLVPQDPNDEPADALLARIGKVKVRGEGEQRNCSPRGRGRSPSGPLPVDAASSPCGRARRPATAALLSIPDEDKPFALPAGWEWVRLGEIVDVLGGLWTGESESRVDVAVLRAANMTRDCEINFNNVVKISVDCQKLERRILKDGDLIVEKSGGGDNQPVGRAVLFEGYSEPCSFCNFTTRLRIVDTVSLIPRFVHLCLKHIYVSGRTIPLQNNTTNLRNLNMNAYLNLPIPLPPLAEQKRIVAKIEELLPLVAKLKT